jgi:glycosyltransferase involved in cell wall biosynthesis
MHYSNPDDNTPLVSVVITTRNEAKNIENCLRSVRLQTYPALEIIVVDNHSTDHTLLLAKPFANQLITKGPERFAQRNEGMIVRAAGEYVMYIDADMLLSPELIAICVQHMQATRDVALHISETILGKGYFSRVRRFERSFYNGTPIDGARFFIRALFTEIGGFDEVLFKTSSGANWDVDKKIKQHGQIGLLSAEALAPYLGTWPLASLISERGVPFNSNYIGIYHNEADFKLIPYLKKKRYYAKGFDGYINKWGKKDPDIQCQFSLKYHYWTVFTENGKWKHLITAPFLTLGMVFLWVLVGGAFLVSRLNMRKY